MKSIKIGPEELAIDDYAIGAAAILGIRDSGKTVTAKGIAEQLLEANIPIVVFDAVGKWKWLRVKGNTQRGKAYKVVVVGGEDGLPLDPTSIEKVVRAAVIERVPIVLDLFSKDLSKADWRRIVQRSIKVSHYENRGGPLHIFLEEAAEYCVDEKTEVLTESGWKYIPDIPEGEVVSTFNLDTGCYEWGSVKRLIRKRFSGDMVNLKSKTIIAVMTGYKTTSRYEYLRVLKSDGFITEHSGGIFKATAKGAVQCGEIKPLPVGQELIDWWMSRLSGGEAKVFEAICRAGRPVSKQELEDVTGYKSTSVYEYARCLVSRDIVVKENDGTYALSGLHIVTGKQIRRAHV